MKNNTSIENVMETMNQIDEAIVIPLNKKGKELIKQVMGKSANNILKNKGILVAIKSLNQSLVLNCNTMEDVIKGTFYSLSESDIKSHTIVFFDPLRSIKTKAMRTSGFMGDIPIVDYFCNSESIVIQTTEGYVQIN